MNWNVAVFGKLAFPRGGRTSWHAQQVDASRFRDWVDEFDGGHLDPATVADVLAAIAAFPGDVNAPGRIDVASTANGVSILGYLEDDGYRSWCAQLAALFRVAAEAGGTGDLWFVDAAGQVAYRVGVAPKASRFERLEGEACAAVWERDEVLEVAALRSGRKPSSCHGNRPSGRDDALYAKIIALLAAVPTAKLESALAARGGLYDPETKQTLTRARDALGVLGRGSIEGLRWYAGYLGIELDRAGMEVIARALLTEGADLALTTMAVNTLHQSKTPDTLAALQKTLWDPRADSVSMPAFDAFKILQKHLGPGFAPLMQGQLTPAFAASANAGVVASIVAVVLAAGIPLPPGVLPVLQKRREPIIHNALATPAPMVPAAKRRIAAKQGAGARKAKSAKPKPGR